MPLALAFEMEGSSAVGKGAPPRDASGEGSCTPLHTRLQLRSGSQVTAGAVGAGMGITLAPATVSAHHAFVAEFDANQPVTFGHQNGMGQSARLDSCGCGAARGVD